MSIDISLYFRDWNEVMDWYGKLWKQWLDNCGWCSDNNYALEQDFKAAQAISL